MGVSTLYGRALDILIYIDIYSNCGKNYNLKYSMRSWLAHLIMVIIVSYRHVVTISFLHFDSLLSKHVNISFCGRYTHKMESHGPICIRNLYFVEGSFDNN